MIFARGLVACAAVACLFLRAPSAQAEDGTFGIAAGATASMYPPPGSGETIALAPGFAIGFYGVIPILKSVSIMPELLYVQKYSERTAPTRANLRVQYVELPILAKMTFVRGTYFAEGISLGFPLKTAGWRRISSASPRRTSRLSSAAATT
jgi:hypothetical protein